MRYILKRKDTGEVILDIPFTSLEAAMPGIKKAMADNNLGDKDVEAEFGREAGDEGKPAADTRRTRADKGSTHNKKTGYLVWNGHTLSELMSKGETEQLLLKAVPEERDAYRVWEAREIEFALKVEGL